MVFQRCLADGCVLKRTNDLGTVVVCVYVDETMCVGDREAINEFKEEMNKNFKTKD